MGAQVHGRAGGMLQAALPGGLEGAPPQPQRMLRQRWGGQQRCVPPGPRRLTDVHRRPSPNPAVRQQQALQQQSLRHAPPRGIRAAIAAVAAACARARRSRWGYGPHRGAALGGGATAAVSRSATQASAKDNVPTAVSTQSMWFGFMKNLLAWIFLYFWFFRSSQVFERVVNLSPMVEAIVYTALGVLPLLLVRARILQRTLFDPILMLARRAKSLFTRQLLFSAAAPFAWSVESVLAFMSVNVLAMAFPFNFKYRLPPQLRFLDPNGDGILTSTEIEKVVMQYSRSLLLAMLATYACWFFIQLKTPPEEDVEGGAAPDHVGASWLEVYWRNVRKRSGVWLLVDVGVTIVAISVTALRWFRLFGLSPETILTFGGVGGIAFGLAAQNLVGNFISGILIMITQPFTVGEYISTNDVDGVVRAIGWNYVNVVTDHGQVVLLPNSEVVGTLAKNRTRGKTRACKISLPVQWKDGGASRFEDVDTLLADLVDHIAALDVVAPLLHGRPAATFKGFPDDGEGAAPRIAVCMRLKNPPSLRMSAVKSRANIEAVKFLLSRDISLPGLMES